MIDINSNNRTVFNIELKSNSRFRILISIAVLLLLWFGYSVFVTLNDGLDSWSIDNNVVWGLAITNFVFWIGIAHAGTLISAILYLFRQDWRKPISKVSETMTLIAILCAAFFPLIHLGRPWFAYWIIPIFNRSELNNNYYSPLTWDFVAVASYFFVSLIFLYLSLIPYFARFSSERKGRLYSILGLNWIGTEAQWGAYNSAYKLIAGLAAALVISVHSIVSYDFAVTQLSGWHSTIFPPYFVIGAILSGTAMLVSILFLADNLFKKDDSARKEHYDKLSKIILFCINALAFIYLTEIFFAWYSAIPAELEIFQYRLGVPFYVMLICIILLPQLLWNRKIRQNKAAVFALSILINLGMWLERYIIISSSLNKGSETIYYPNAVEFGLTFGSLGLFLLLFIIAIRTLPILEFNLKSK